MSNLPSQPSKLDIPEILGVLFHPVAQSRSELPDRATDMDIKVGSPAEHIGCRLHSCGDSSAPLILYFHGNGETVADYDEIGRLYNQAGLNILVTSYRGYGWSSGMPSVSNLLGDSRQILQYVLDLSDPAIPSGPLFVMGRSLGAAAAIECVFQQPDEIKGLIIESGFADSLPLIARLGLSLADTGISEEDCFNNVAKITAISIPTLIMHGSRDQLIPVHEAEKLQAESGAKAKQFQMIPGADHNTLILVGGDQYFNTIKSFADTVTGQNTWRQRRKKFKAQE